MSVAEIADKLDVSRQLVHLWRERHPEFPQPIARLGGDTPRNNNSGEDTRKRKVGVLVWNWPDIEKWATATGRYPPQAPKG